MRPYERMGRAVMERLFNAELEGDAVAEERLLELAVECGVARRMVHEDNDGHDVDAFERLGEEELHPEWAGELVGAGAGAGGE